MRNLTIFDASQCVAGNSQLIENSLINAKMLVYNTSAYWLAVSSQDGQIAYPSIPPFTIFPFTAETPSTVFTISASLPIANTTFPSTSFSVVVSYVSILPLNIVTMNVGQTTYQPTPSGNTLSQTTFYDEKNLQLVYEHTGNSCLDFYRGVDNPTGVITNSIEAGVLLCVFETNAVLSSNFYESNTFEYPWLDENKNDVYPYLNGFGVPTEPYTTIAFQSLIYDPPLTTFFNEVILANGLRSVLPYPTVDGIFRFRIFNVHNQIIKNMSNNTSFTETIPITDNTVFSGVVFIITI